jgi:hypothetical protein
VREAYSPLPISIFLSIAVKAHDNSRKHCCHVFGEWSRYYVIAARMLATVLLPDEDIIIGTDGSDDDLSSEEAIERVGLPVKCPEDDVDPACSENLESQLQRASWHQHSPFNPFVRKTGRRVALEHLYGPIDDQWKLPWDDFASAPLWETMEIPTYSSSDDEDDDDEAAGLKRDGIGDDVHEPEGEEDDRGDVETDEDAESNASTEQELRVFFNTQVENQVVESLELLSLALPSVRTITADEYAQTLGMLRRNIIGTTTEGLGLYAYHSTINHSSEPNAVVTGDVDVPGAHVLIVAQKDISSGEEILVDYLPPTRVLQEWAAEERRVQQRVGNTDGPATEGDTIIEPEEEILAAAAGTAVVERAERERTLFSQFGIAIRKTDAS